MKRLALALLGLWLSGAAQAQTNFNMPPPAGVSIIGLQVVPTCGVGALSTTTPGFMVMNQLGQLCTNASGGGGGAVTVADGADVTQGAKADAATCATGNSGIACLRQIDADIKGPIPTQAPTVSIGGTGIVDSAGTNVGTVKAASTRPASTDTTLVIGFNPIAGLPPSPSGSGALTANSCGSAVSSCVLKASAGNLYGVYANCTSACWLMVFNAVSAPSNGSTTAGTGSGNLTDCVAIPANGNQSITYPTFPKPMSVGITAIISSTACGTLTLSTVGFISGTVM